FPQAIAAQPTLLPDILSPTLPTKAPSSRSSKCLLLHAPHPSAVYLKNSPRSSTSPKCFFIEEAAGEIQHPNSSDSTLPFKTPYHQKAPQSLSDCPSRPFPVSIVCPQDIYSPHAPKRAEPSGPALAQVQLLVLREVRLVAEALATAGAFVRLVAGVDAAVADEVRALDEAFATLDACVGLLARVRALVLRERGEVAEALLALAAAEGLLARVHPQVVHEVRVAPEALAALAAHVGPLARVRALVREEVRADTEGLAALGAHVGLLARVHPLVLHQVRAPAEALAALAAAVRLLAGVDALVVSQVRAAHEALAALAAGEGPQRRRSRAAGRRVRAPVAQQVRAEAEGLAALGARVGLLARVQAPVLEQVGAPAEALAAVGAQVGPLARVQAQVVGQGGSGICCRTRTVLGTSPSQLRQVPTIPSHLVLPRENLRISVLRAPKPAESSLTCPLTLQFFGHLSLGLGPTHGT
uniref:Uncharacterized protein n=1 Tax=Equus caballus TaxID=9796 RepID=A0A9L0RCL1_HORSE